MKRHIRYKHPYIYEKEVRTSQVDFQEDDSITLTDTEEYLNEESLRVVGDSMKIQRSDYDPDTAISHEEVVETDPEVREKEKGLNKSSYLDEVDPDFEEKVRFLCAKPVLKSKYFL